MMMHVNLACYIFLESVSILERERVGEGKR